MRIRRDERAGEFSINKWTRICSLHFEDEDYQEPSRQRKRQTSRKNRHLKKTAVPSKFECFPEHLRTSSAGKRRSPTDWTSLELTPKRRARAGPDASALLGSEPTPEEEKEEEVEESVGQSRFALQVYARRPTLFVRPRSSRADGGVEVEVE